MSGKAESRVGRGLDYAVDRFLIHLRISRLRGPRNVLCGSHHRHHAFAAPCAQCRSGSAHACMQLTDCRRETASKTAPNARFMEATFRVGHASPVPAWGKSPCARNGRRCLRCRVSRIAEAAVVPTLGHPAFVSGHAPIAAPRVVSRVQRSVMPERRPYTPHDAAAGCGAAGLKFASSRMTPHAPACTARRIIQPAGLSA
ncbi:hypothetical protein ACEPUD_03265 [Burkholderia ubonensis]|uniref:hypothetical protein n=1 Tax=Burkholderia ubonensis TaxID=101571 RepID=UPI00358F25B0